MKLNIRIQQTADGSDTLFVPEMDEHYHSINGAIQESEHVFISAGLEEISRNKKEISILEIGFGTGLNTFLTLIYSESNNLEINYTTLELYPLVKEITEKLNYWQRFNSKYKEFFMQMHTCDWNIPVDITSNFKLHKIQSDFSKLNLETDKKFDLIYFDAFAPDKQSEMWSQEIFNYLYNHTNPEGILTTYCAKGIVRRMMQQAGYFVERLPGPPGKREMLRAKKMLNI